MTQFEKTIISDLDNAQTIIHEFIIQYAVTMKVPLKKLSAIVAPKRHNLSQPFLQTEIEDIEKNLLTIETILNQLMADIQEAKTNL